MLTTSEVALALAELPNEEWSQQQDRAGSRSSSARSLANSGVNKRKSHRSTKSMEDVLAQTKSSTEARTASSSGSLNSQGLGTADEKRQSFFTYPRTGN